MESLAMFGFKDQEEVSFSYFAAVTAKTNAILDYCRRDDDGIDATIRKRITIKDKQLDSVLSFQLKSVFSKNHYKFDDDGNLVYSLKIKNYEDLIIGSNVDKYLLVMILPENKDEWVEISFNELSIKKNMYFISLKNMPHSSNKHTIDIKIPKDNLLNSNTLDILLKGVFEEETNNE